jgi:riboflavin kinase/FMN adenylyltransferase
MHVIRHLEELPSEALDGAVAIGNFDGVHLGHARIVELLLARAREVNGPAVVFTFDPHPVRILRPEQSPAPLTWTERKAELLAQLGVDWIVAYPTDEALLQLSPSEFFSRIVCNALQARAMVEGPNFYFGHNRAGTIGVLRELCERAGISLDIAQQVEVDGKIVSSSRVRQLIHDGHVDAAGRMLTAPYRIRGIVTHGAGRGAKLGFPTANLEGVDTLLPAHGVYAGRAWFEGHNWPAAINLGPNPTFGEAAAKVEAHLVNYHEALYGKPLEIDFLTRLRGTRPFAAADELIAQIRNDVAEAEKIALAEKAND